MRYTKVVSTVIVLLGTPISFIYGIDYSNIMDVFLVEIPNGEDRSLALIVRKIFLEEVRNSENVIPLILSIGELV